MRLPTSSSPVTFRLDRKTRSRLEVRAEEFGCSPGEYARAVLKAHLDNEELARVLAVLESLGEHHDERTELLSRRLEALCNEVATLRKDFNQAVDRP